MANLDSSYQWLKREEFSFPYTLGLLISQMHQAAQKSRQPIVDFYAKEAIELGDRLRVPLEMSVVRLECAIAYSRVNLPERAPELIRQGVVTLLPYVEKDRDNKHYYAVANWLSGWILVDSPQHRLDVIYKWNISLEAFGSLVYYQHNLTRDKEWYRNRYQEMKLEIKKLILKEPPSPPQDNIQSIRLPDDWPVAQLFTGGHQILQVIGKIPAGAFSPISGDSHADEKIDLEPEMDTFLLSGSDHSMYNLRGPDQVIRLNSAQEYFLLHVTGDSMNRAKIDGGDYVLIRRQEIAKDRDIIAVSIQTDDQEATLKRYREQNEMIILQPESSNGAWKPREFTRQDLNAGGKAWKFRIHGVALAVFKPSRKANS